MKGKENIAVDALSGCIVEAVEGCCEVQDPP